MNDLYPYKYNVKWCYGLKDLTLAQYQFTDKNGANPTLKQITTVFATYIGVPSIVDVENQFIERLWQTMIVRYLDEFIIISDEELTSAQVQSYFYKWMNKKFFMQLEFTYSKYTTLLKYYADKAANLMDGIKRTSSSSTSGESSSVDKFNDTPQNEGEYIDNDHVSTLTQNETSQSAQGSDQILDERDTTMARIDELQTKYRNLFAEWVESFDKLFIDELNYR